MDLANKGMDLLLHALHRLPDALEWKLTCFGIGPDLPTLKRLSHQLGLSRRVNFAGYKSDKASIWSQCHALVLPSLAEGCSLAMLEALSIGRPVFTTDAGGSSDWIRAGKNGDICAKGSITELSNMLQRSLESFNQWSQMGSTGQQIMQELYQANSETLILRTLGKAIAAE